MEVVVVGAAFSTKLLRLFTRKKNKRNQKVSDKIYNRRYAELGIEWLPGAEALLQQALLHRHAALVRLAARRVPSRSRGLVAVRWW